MVQVRCLVIRDAVVVIVMAVVRSVMAVGSGFGRCWRQYAARIEVAGGASEPPS
jgi:hypothetical protein